MENKNHDKEIEDKIVSSLTKQTKRPTVSVVGSGLTGKLVPRLLDAGINVIVVNSEKQHTFSLNGKTYEIKDNSIKKQVENNLFNFTFETYYNAAMSLINSLQRFEYERHYRRSLNDDVNIIIEYGLIETKQSKLSRWERAEVVRIFEQTFKLVENGK